MRHSDFLCREEDLLPWCIENSQVFCASSILQWGRPPNELLQLCSVFILDLPPFLVCVNKTSQTRVLCQCAHTKNQSAKSELSFPTVCTRPLNFAAASLGCNRSLLPVSLPGSADQCDSFLTSIAGYSVRERSMMSDLPIGHC